MGLSDIAASLTSGPKGMQLFSDAYVFADGTMLAMAASVSLEKKSNSTPINTLHKGFAGLSKGAGVSELTIESAVPSKDFEMVGKALVDFWIMSGEPVEFGIVMGARTTRLKGIIDQASYTQSVNDSSKVSIHIIGRLEAFE